MLSGGELSRFFLCLQHLLLENVATAESGFALPVVGGCDSCHLGLVAVGRYQDGGCGGRGQTAALCRGCRAAGWGRFGEIRLRLVAWGGKVHSYVSAQFTPLCFWAL